MLWKVRELVAAAALVTASAGVLATPAEAAGGSAAKAPLLGSAAFEVPGQGWGRAQPRTIDNGGDPSGIVTKIAWAHWGAAVSYGKGQSSIFMPGGGYYPRLVTIQLRAQSLGRCSAHGPVAYTRLYAREPSRPGGPLGRWFAWSGAKTLCKPAY